ncbi:hypothetical protein BJ166DRAFT_517015 [Pestalotiopsis sp. NC0098]|nr:hypothetical protein BJ166DRAFT_517015 [Pestalotiopsis sp. NC0098]
MRHGWISDKAKSFALDWMISYVTGICVEESALDLSETVTKFNRRAANFFPSILDRQQLDKLWEEALASRRAGLEEGQQGPWKCSINRIKTIPWLRINVERNDGDAIAALLASNYADPQINQDDEDASCEEPRRQSNLMRATYRGHRGAAGPLVAYGVNTPRASFLSCNHHPDADEIDNLCEICPYGQTSACEIAFAQGEVGIFGAMWDWPPSCLSEEKLEMRWWNTDLFDTPMVYSHGNVMAEWLQLKLGMQDWMELKMTGEHACWMRQEIQDRLAKLSAEVCEIRDAWQARAKSSDEMRGHAPYR